MLIHFPYLSGWDKNGFMSSVNPIRAKEINPAFLFVQLNKETHCSLLQMKEKNTYFCNVLIFILGQWKGMKWNKFYVADPHLKKRKKNLNVLLPLNSWIRSHVRVKYSVTLDKIFLSSFKLLCTERSITTSQKVLSGIKQQSVLMETQVSKELCKNERNCTWGYVSNQKI